jgi:hypothetical protein
MKEVSEKAKDVRLFTAKDGKKFLARLINELRRDELTESKAKALGYLANSFIKACETTELEKKLNEYIEIVEEMKNASQIK